MSTSVSNSNSTSQTTQTFCVLEKTKNCVSNLYQTIHDVVMKIIKTIGECFEACKSSVPKIFTKTEAPDPKNIVAFYLCLEPNENHITIDEILRQNDDALESGHNYIQWLFPLETKSRSYSNAPILDRATIKRFRNDGALQLHLERCFARMLDFYGLRMDVNTLTISRAQNFNSRAAVWLTTDNHNFLRISRIIHSVGLLGLPNHSRAFLNIMQDIAQNEGAGIVNEANLRFWRGACIS